MNNPYTEMLIKAVSDQSSPLTMIALLIVLATLANALLTPKRKRGRGRRPNWRHQQARPFGGPHHDALPSRMPDAADQLRTVMGAQFKTKRLLNKGESRVLAALEPLVAELAPGWRVMAQVSLGEVLDADSTEAFNTINAKKGRLSPGRCRAASTACDRVSGARSSPRHGGSAGRGEKGGAAPRRRGLRRGVPERHARRAEAIGASVVHGHRSTFVVGRGENDCFAIGCLVEKRRGLATADEPRE